MKYDVHLDFQNCWVVTEQFRVFLDYEHWLYLPKKYQTLYDLLVDDKFYNNEFDKLGGKLYGHMS